MAMYVLAMVLVIIAELGFDEGGASVPQRACAGA
jgi:hypothetical protein